MKAWWLFVGLVGCGGTSFSISETEALATDAAVESAPSAPEASVDARSADDSYQADAVEECIPPPSADNLARLCNPNIQQLIPQFGCGFIHYECSRGLPVAGKGLPGYTTQCYCESGSCHLVGPDPDWGTCEP